MQNRNQTPGNIILHVIIKNTLIKYTVKQKKKKTTIRK